MVRPLWLADTVGDRMVGRTNRGRRATDRALNGEDRGASRLAAVTCAGSVQAQPTPAEADSEAELMGYLQWREGRTSHFPNGLFSDPAWDILLELYSAEAGRRRISIRELTAASRVPASSALRWLSLLESHGLLRLKGDPRDADGSSVELTAAGRYAMQSFLAERGVPRIRL